MVGLFLILLYAGCPVLGVFEQHEQVASSFAKSKVEMAALEALQQYEVTRNGIVFYGSFSIRLWETIARDMAPWPVVKPGFGGAKLPDIVHFAPRILGPHLSVHNPNRCRAVVVRRQLEVRFVLTQGFGYRTVIVASLEMLPK